MKKVACLLPLLLCIFCLTGCIRFNTTITVKSNGKADISMLYATIDSSSYSELEDESTTKELKPELRQKYTDDGWAVEDYSKDGYSGQILSINDVDLIELSARLKDTNELVASANNATEKKDENSGFSLERDGLKYRINWQVFDETNNNISEAATYIKASNGYMKFTLNLPVKPDSSNATKVLNDGKTLEWDLLELGEDGKVEVTFGLISIPLIITIVVVVLVMIAAVVVTIIVISKKKKTPVEQPTTEVL